MFLRSLGLVVVVSLAGAVSAYAQAKSPVEGVWKVAEVQATSAQPGHERESAAWPLHLHPRPLQHHGHQRR